MRHGGLTIALSVLLLVIAAMATAEEPATAGGIYVNSRTVSSAADDVTALILGVLSNEIDQNQPSNTVYMAAFSQGDLAQSFKQDNANISGAGIYLRENIGSSDSVNIGVWDGLPDEGGTLLADAGAIGTQGQWVDVFWEPIAITPGTTYYLVFTGNMTLGISGDTSNPYPDGMVYANSGYTPFPNYDYTFRTYYETEFALDRSTWGEIKAAY